MAAFWSMFCVQISRHPARPTSRACSALSAAETPFPRSSARTPVSTVLSRCGASSRSMRQVSFCQRLRDHIVPHRRHIEDALDVMTALVQAEVPGDGKPIWFGVRHCHHHAGAPGTAHELLQMGQECAPDQATSFPGRDPHVGHAAPSGRYGRADREAPSHRCAIALTDEHHDRAGWRSGPLWVGWARRPVSSRADLRFQLV